MDGSSLWGLLHACLLWGYVQFFIFFIKLWILDSIFFPNIHLLLTTFCMWICTHMHTISVNLLLTGCPFTPNELTPESWPRPNHWCHLVRSLLIGLETRRLWRICASATPPLPASLSPTISDPHQNNTTLTSPCFVGGRLQLPTKPSLQRHITGLFFLFPLHY